MTLINLAFKSIINRKASVLLTLFTIAISVMLLLSIERVRQEAKQSFSSTISGTDLIVGARTGDIQLLLSSVFRIGHANNGLSWHSYEYIKAQKGVAWTIPISLGDSHKGFSVLGSDENYFEHYRYGNKHPLSFAHGRPYHNAQEVVIGSEVAKQLHYYLGQKIVVSHGMGNTSFHHHDDNPLVIVGILEPTGTPVDKTLHVPLKAIEQMHGPKHTGTHLIGRKSHDDAHDHDHDHDHHRHNNEALNSQPGDLVGKPKQITAFLMGFESPLYTLQVRRNINTYEPEALSAIMPGVTLRELWGMLDIVEKILMLFSGVVVLISLLGMLTTLLSSLNQRRRELAILRSVGARPHHIFTLMTSEAILITALGCIVGLTLFYSLIFIGKGVLQAQFGISITLSMLNSYELLLLGVIMVSGTVIGAIPAIRAYFYSLNDGMSIKV
ncbi:peptide ABC transporter permease [Pseudoalteromonas luteoviolacea]|uniref:Peptide ABC transporter permease n=1 Tax=Pseudoalteromonas luteoviolacea TaxID=43657 RepID=A0A0C1Q3N7_9GAMM|nr:ABC transporter permease [Pseudoalteromonas luteoviolacea]KID55216.1 peptide ABC transporter permease [Pseudoalteromonas luteoviolacea]